MYDANNYKVQIIIIIIAYVLSSKYQRCIMYARFRIHQKSYFFFIRTRYPRSRARSMLIIIGLDFPWNFSASWFLAREQLETYIHPTDVLEHVNKHVFVNNNLRNVNAVFSYISSSGVWRAEIVNNIFAVSRETLLSVYHIT